jgi:hypothetical protein
VKIARDPVKMRRSIRRLPSGKVFHVIERRPGREDHYIVPSRNLRRFLKGAYRPDRAQGTKTRKRSRPHAHYAWGRKMGLRWFHGMRK